MPTDLEPLDIADLHSRALELCGSAFGSIADAALPGSTPCTDWDLRTLANHVVSENLWVAPLVEGKTIAEVGDRFDGDLLGTDPAGAYEASARSADAAFHSPGAMTTPVAVSYGPIPGAVLCAHRYLDLVIHGWDIAQSLGIDYVVPADMVDALNRILTDERDLIRGSGVFGSEVPVRSDADPWVRALAQVGRSING